MILKTWNIRVCGWQVYFEEVALLTRGRPDVAIHCAEPMVISVVDVVERQT